MRLLHLCHVTRYQRSVRHLMSSAWKLTYSELNFDVVNSSRSLEAARVQYRFQTVYKMSQNMLSVSSKTIVSPLTSVSHCITNLSHSIVRGWHWVARRLWCQLRAWQMMLEPEQQHLPSPHPCNQHTTLDNLLQSNTLRNHTCLLLNLLSLKSIRLLT